MDPALIGTALNFGMQQANNSNQFAANREDKAFQIEMWNRTNEYNSPQKQMERFKAAGLNPHLIYGRGDSGNATQITPIETKAQTFDTNVVQDYLKLKAMDKQIENQDIEKQLLAMRLEEEKEDMLYRMLDQAPSSHQGDTFEWYVDGKNMRDLYDSERWKRTVAERKSLESSISSKDQDTANKKILEQLLNQDIELKKYDVSQAQADKMLWDKYQITREDSDQMRIFKIMIVNNPALAKYKAKIFEWLGATQ